MPLPRKKQRRFVLRQWELPAHIKRAEVSNHNWRCQCRPRKYSVKLRLNQPLSELHPLKYILIQTQKDLWQNIISMLIAMDVPSDYAEPLYARITVSLREHRRLTGVELYEEMNSLMKEPDILKTRTVHYEEKPDLPEIYRKGVRPNFT
jgi:hypothetical protein